MSYSPKFRGDAANAASRQTQTKYVNATGGTIAQCTPVYVNASGQILVVNAATEPTVLSMVGLAGTDILIGALGPVVDFGRLENANISFAIGDPLWVSKAGFLTNIKPDIGINGFVAGDFVMFVGVVVKNEFNALIKDIKLMPYLVGEL